MTYFFNSIIANDADNNTFYATGDCFEVIIEKLSADLISLQSWLHENYIKCVGKKSRNCWEFLFFIKVLIDHKLNILGAHKNYLSNGREETECPNKIILFNISISAKANS